MSAQLSIANRKGDTLKMSYSSTSQCIPLQCIALDFIAASDQKRFLRDCGWDNLHFEHSRCALCGVVTRRGGWGRKGGCMTGTLISTDRVKAEK